MKRLTGKQLKHKDGRTAYYLGRDREPGYFRVIAFTGTGVRRERWHASELDEKTLVSALGLAGEEASHGSVP